MVLDSFGRSSGEGQGHPLPVTGMGYPVGVIKPDNFVAAYAGPEDMWERPGFEPKLTATSNRPGASLKNS